MARPFFCAGENTCANDMKGTEKGCGLSGGLIAARRRTTATTYGSNYAGRIGTAIDGCGGGEFGSSGKRRGWWKETSNEPEDG